MPTTQCTAPEKEPTEQEQWVYMIKMSEDEYQATLELLAERRNISVEQVAEENSDSLAAA